MIEQPSEMQIDLYPHQLASVYMMEKLEREQQAKSDDCMLETDLGILADLTGFGKSLSIVTLIARDKMLWDMSEDHTVKEITTFASQHIRKITQKSHIKIDTTLLLVGPLVYQQWLDELSHTTLRVRKVTTRREACNVDAYDYDVVIVVVSMFNRFVERYHNIAWKRFIFDEPGHLRVPAMRKVCAGFTWFVTATPEAIAPRHHNCSTSYMCKLIGGLYDFDRFRTDITVKNDDDFVRQSFEMPATHHEYHQCHSPLYNTIHGLVSDKIKNMIEAGNISGAIQSLGGQRTDNIVDLVMKRKNLELEEIQSKIRIWSLRSEEKKIEEWKDRESEVLKQMDILTKRFENILMNNCVICQSQLSKPVMEPGCQNIFCGNCLLTWLQRKNSCPICRRPVRDEELTYIVTNGEGKNFEKERNMTKEETIINIISGKKGRFIIFSDWDETFDTIRSVLKENKIKFAEIKGSIKSCTKALEKYKEGKINVIFLNSKYNSSGINMQETTDIILYHQMGEDSKTQILGRANRIGRQTPLQVHHLVNEEL